MVQFSPGGGMSPRVQGVGPVRRWSVSTQPCTAWPSLAASLYSPVFGRCRERSRDCAGQAAWYLRSLMDTFRSGNRREGSASTPGDRDTASHPVNCLQSKQAAPGRSGPPLTTFLTWGPPWAS